MNCTPVSLFSSSPMPSLVAIPIPTTLVIYKDKFHSSLCTSAAGADSYKSFSTASIKHISLKAEGKTKSPLFHWAISGPNLGEF